MSIVGSWDVTINTPFGAEVVMLDFNDEHSGLARYGGDSVALENVSVSGDALTCSVKLTAPLAVTLKCAVTVNDDALSGTASAGLLGKFTVTGRRSSGR